MRLAVRASVVRLVPNDARPHDDDDIDETTPPEDAEQPSPEQSPSQKPSQSPASIHSEGPEAANAAINEIPNIQLLQDDDGDGEQPNQRDPPEPTPDSSSSQSVRYRQPANEMDVIEALFVVPGRAAPKEIDWRKFEKFMVRRGFGVDRGGGGGSKVTFKRQTDNATFTYDKPHDNRVDISKARNIGNGLSKRFGWEFETFEEE
ncbi:hypothetical protein F5B20DRAFT_585028 [Whalleya microplaca]|nr:hypothetical protein F5B20DRAFT_585028 [Whalleya microplaca]